MRNRNRKFTDRRDAEAKFKPADVDAPEQFIPHSMVYDDQADLFKCLHCPTVTIDSVVDYYVSGGCVDQSDPSWCAEHFSPTHLCENLHGPIVLKFERHLALVK